MMRLLTDAAHWRSKRAEYLQGARNCKETLTNPNGHWRYPPNDPRVNAAVAKWVIRARNAHAFALGRKPVIPNFLYMGPEGSYQGPLYAREAA
jgi:hypothetical protein